MGERTTTIALVVAASLLLSACSGSTGGGPGQATDDRAAPTAIATGTATRGAPTAPGPTTSAPGVTGDGATVPDLEVESFDGGTVSLADLAGRPMVVNFWASWCPPCIVEMPDLEAVHAAAGDRVRFVGVNTQDVADAADDLAEQTGVTYDLVRDPDGELFAAFGVFGMPSTFYVAADGTIVERHTGLLTRDALVQDLRDHLGVDVEPAG